VHPNACHSTAMRNIGILPDASAITYLSVVEKHLPAFQLVRHGAGGAMDFAGDGTQRLFLSTACLDDDALFERKMRPFSAGRICGKIYLIHSDTSLECWFADYILP